MTDYDSGVNYIKNTHKPFVILIKKGTFNTFKDPNKVGSNVTQTQKAQMVTTPAPQLKRYDVIQDITEKLGQNNNSVFVSATGYTSRELYYI